MGLTFGMTKEEVNNLIRDKGVELLDEIYKGNRFKHKWICKKCKEDFLRSWVSLTNNKIWKCLNCERIKIKQKYKEKMSEIKGYEYLETYFKGDVLPSGKIANKVYLLVRHKYCGEIYETGATNFIKHNKRKRCCCGDVENSLWYKSPNIANMIAFDENGNKVNAELIHELSNKKFYFKCLNCGEISKKTHSLSSVVQFGYSCKFCSDGISIPEKFMTNILKQLNIDFIVQLSKRDMNWINGNFRYDFYIPSLNCIIETHGVQHKKEKKINNSSRTLEEEQENDRIKKQLALENGIKHYIIIDCEKSEFDFLKENYTKTLSKYIELEKVNWEKAWEESQTSLCVKAWELWNQKNSVQYIAKKLNISDTTVRTYLKRGVKLKKCNYDGKFERAKCQKNDPHHVRKVKCLTTGESFCSITKASKKYKVSISCIVSCCKGLQKSAGKLSDGTRLVWSYI